LASSRGEDDPFGAGSRDPYAAARSKALGLMKAAPGKAKASPAATWCHCGACDAIDSATEKALAVMADCPCKPTDRCKPGDCPGCCPCPAASYAWKQVPGIPGWQYLYLGDMCVGAFDGKTEWVRDNTVWRLKTAAADGDGEENCGACCRGRLRGILRRR
jgi:hypothetical protein